MRLANTGDVSANKARCLLLARANAQDTDSGAVVAERQRIRANFRAGKACTTFLGRHTNWRSRFAPPAGYCTGLAALPLPNAFAADSSDQEPTLKSVTVTATRREESLQKVPVAVSVIDGEQLERDNRNGVASIVQQVPSLNFRTGASNKDTSLFVRGVGTISTSPGVEPTVATVIDGVVYARPGQATLDLLDLERVEVLRGPQGTLFGKNASAGVLNITSKAPTAETHGYIDQSYYSGNESRTRFGIGGSLIPDTLKGSISTLFGSYDGNVDNQHNGQEVNGYNHQAACAANWNSPRMTTSRSP